MKGNKGIIKHQQNKSSRNSDDGKLDQIGTALVNIGINYARNVFLVFEKSSGKLVSEGIFVKGEYENKEEYQINNCDIVANVLGKKLYIELDGKAIHGTCDSAETISEKTWQILQVSRSAMAISRLSCAYLLFKNSLQ